MQDIAAIILAAGEGTRMRSNRAKVLHEIAGVPMIRYVVEAALAVMDNVVVVVGYQAQDVRKVLASYPMLRFALQQQQLGTGHAVLCGMPEVPARVQDVVVLCGDTPLIRPETIRALIERHRPGNNCLSLITALVREPFGYGRVVLDERGKPMRIVEESDASESEKKIAVVNTGMYCINVSFLKEALALLKDDNVQGEFYLTDVVERAYKAGRPAVLLEASDTTEVIGVNTAEDLAKAERFFKMTLGEGGREYA